MLEIDVDVGRLLPLFGQEAFDQKLGRFGVDGGDAQHITDGGIGCRTAALAENAVLAGEIDDFVDGQEIARIFSAS